MLLQTLKSEARGLSRNVLVGAVIFSVGLFLSGQCLGSAVAILGTGNLSVLAGIASMFIGENIRGLFDS